MPDNHDKKYVREAVSKALSDFWSIDYLLLKNDANERSITHKFAEHLKNYFPTWNVDCEYNRDGNNIKRLNLEPLIKKVNSDDDKGETVYPDIIVHERGKENNLLVIEAKKDNNSTVEAVKLDKFKLSKYKSDLGYKFALFITFNTETNYKKPPIEEWC